MPTSPDDNYLIDKVDDPIARSSANSLIGLGTELVSKIYDRFKDQNQAATAAAAYASKYCDRYGKIKLFGMSQDIELQEVYTAVKFLDSLSIRNRFGSLNALEDNYRSAASRRLQQGESKPVKGSKVANEHQYLYVLGNPGAGKSTFLRRVGLEAIKGRKGNYQHDYIPVMVELKQFNKGSVDLVSAIANELAYFNFPDKKQAAEDYLKQGKLLLLFDGLDEVPQAYAEEVQDRIDKLKTQYSHNRFILSCRVAAYKSSMTGFTTVELADFDEEQIEKFITNWFSSEEAKQDQVADSCWAKLSQPEYKASLELAQTPLLLTFLCITYDTYRDFPAQRNQLYAEALDILLRKWDAQKRGIKRDNIKDIYRNWNINLELALLSELAHDFFAADELFFAKDRILEYIQVFLSDTEGDAKFIDTEAVLNAIVVQQGILVERAKDIYSFSHLTLQEYLTAKYISQDNKRIEKLISEHLTDERWQEVFLLVAGIKDNADELLLLMEKETHQLINTARLKDLLIWVAKITDPSDGDIKYLGKRAIAIANAIAYAIDKLLRYANWSQKYQIYLDVDYAALKIELENLKQQIPDNNQPSKVRQKFTQDLVNTWLSYFSTSQAELNLSQQELID
ncbi:MAG: NACHT domain-containing protein [Cyanobacteria bacterium P01_G01_bin.39]